MGFLTAPTYLEIIQKGENVHLAVWIQGGIWGRIITFFIVPKTMGIESGGFVGVVPREFARDQINKFLKEIGVEVRIK